LPIFVKFDRIIEEGGMVMKKVFKNSCNAGVEPLSGRGAF
jgi:hypothetical protein